MATNNASVKAVISGDTLVLIGRASAQGPPQEITITLASLQAPKISRGPQQNDEEPFAYESKEFLRKLCIGKNVTFKIVHCITSINKYFGDVDLILNSSSESESESVSLSKLVVEAGWASVKDSREGKNSFVHDELVVLENKAKRLNIGLFTNDPVKKSNSLRKLVWTPTANDIKTIFNKYRNIPTKALVEFVRDGSSFRVYVVEIQTFISFSLAGVVAPRINNLGGTNKSNQDLVNSVESEEENVKVKSASTATSEPYSFQSRHFSELRLLCREVDIVMETLEEKTSVVLGSILHPKGNIAVELVRNGLAKTSDRNNKNHELTLSLLQAEQEAKANRRFLWENVSDLPLSTIKGPRVLTGVCVEVLSGDTIVIVSLPPGVSFTSSGDVEFDPSFVKNEVKISFASIKAPKIGQSRGKAGNTPSEPWALESKDFIRSRLLGRKVAVTVEYNKQFIQQKAKSGKVSTETGEGEEEDNNESSFTRVFGTVRVIGSGNQSLSNQSVGMQLVSEGLANVLKPRKDEPRSAELDALQIAEAEAGVKGKGLHGKQVPNLSNASLTTIDLSSDGKKAKTHFALLPKTPLRGIVEYVYSGARVKVFLPSENCLVQMSLSQVRCPLPARQASQQSAARAAEPFSEEAKQFTRFYLNQRLVEVVLDDIDKNGVMLGRISIVNEENRKKSSPYALSLLKAGLARLDRYALDRMTDNEAVRVLQETQDEAMSVKKGLWILEPEPTVVSAEGEEEELMEEGENEGVVVEKPKGPKWRLGNLVPVEVSEITNGTSFFVQDQDSITILKSLTQDLETFASSAAPGEIKKGSLASVLFEESASEGVEARKYWCRVRVEDIVSSTEVLVFFIDYGNKAVVQTSKLVSLSGLEDSNRLVQTPALARSCRLAFLRPPPSPKAADGTPDEWFASLGDMAGCLFHDLTWGKKLQCFIVAVEQENNSNNSNNYKKDYKSKNNANSSAAGAASSVVSYVALYPEDYTLPVKSIDKEAEFPVIGDDEEEEEVKADVTRKFLSVNEEVVREGLATVSIKAARAVRKGPRRGSKVSVLTNELSLDLLTRVEENQEFAHNDHINLFRYGDPGDESDDDFGEDSNYLAMKTAKENKDSTKPKDAKETKDGKEAKDAKPVKDNKDTSKSGKSNKPK